METVTDNITIELFNDQYLYLRIPAMTFLAFLLPIGILGNAAAIYIFGFRLKFRIVTFYLTLMAISDIICCFIGIPMEIYRLHSYYNYSYNTMCKVKAYIVFTCNIYSVMMLFILSMERYISITRSTEAHMNFGSARVLGMLIIILSILMAIPVHAWSGVRSFTLDNGVTVFECVTFIERQLWYYYMGLLIFCIVTCIMMFVLYWFVFITVRVQHKWNRRMQLEAKTDVELSMYQEIQNMLTQQRVINWTSVWISIASVMTYAVYFTYVLVTKLVTHLKAPNPYDYFLFVLGETWLLHSTLNPIVYVFLNAEFRNELIKMLAGLFSKATRGNLKSSTERTAPIVKTPERTAPIVKTPDLQ